MQMVKCKNMTFQHEYGQNMGSRQLQSRPNNPITDIELGGVPDRPNRRSSSPAKNTISFLL